jgi:hypothetical protein
MNLVKASVSRFEIGVDKEGEEEELQEGIELNLVKAPRGIGGGCMKKEEEMFVVVALLT